MAYTVTKHRVSLGNRIMYICDVTADAASGTVPVGLGKIESISLGPQSMASSAIKIASSGQTITISNAANGDAFFLHVIGRA